MYTGDKSSFWKLWAIVTVPHGRPSILIRSTFLILYFYYYHFLKVSFSWFWKKNVVTNSRHETSCLKVSILLIKLIGKIHGFKFRWWHNISILVLVELCFFPISFHVFSSSSHTFDMFFKLWIVEFLDK